MLESHNAQRGDYSGMTPPWFAEYLFRVYTKKPQFFGLVQAGYRAVLANMPTQFDLERPETLVTPSNLDSTALTPPATQAPSTPKTKDHSRNNSFTFPVASASSTTTPFSNNSFTTVPPSFAQDSPSQSSIRKRRSASGKRLYQDSQTSLVRHDGSPKKKLRQ